MRKNQRDRSNDPWDDMHLDDLFASAGLHGPEEMEAIRDMFLVENEDYGRRTTGRVEPWAKKIAPQGWTVGTLSKQVLEVCLGRRVSLEAVEMAVLPNWGFSYQFSSRQYFEEIILNHADPAETIDGVMGMATGFDLRFCKKSVSYRCVKWVERLNGTVIALLLTKGGSRLNDMRLSESWVMDEWFCEGVMLALRTIPWAPEYAWLFPQWYRDRMAFLHWVGKVLQLNPAWQHVVLSFLPVESIISARTRSDRAIDNGCKCDHCFRRRVGDRAYYGTEYWPPASAKASSFDEVSSWQAEYGGA
jgi:hypothetical protein